MQVYTGALSLSAASVHGSVNGPQDASLAGNNQNSEHQVCWGWIRSL